MDAITFFQKVREAFELAGGQTYAVNVSPNVADGTTKFSFCCALAESRPPLKPVTVSYEWEPGHYDYFTIYDNLPMVDGVLLFELEQPDDAYYEGLPGRECSDGCHECSIAAETVGEAISGIAPLAKAVIASLRTGPRDTEGQE